MEAKEREKPLVKDLNEHIVCPLCRGYLIDATTLVECLHSFCRGCIVRRLSSGARACPVCNVAASPPLLPDTRLQRLVYLAVPGLFRSELERRRHFRLVNPQCPPLTLAVGALDLTLDDLVSLSLQELDEAEDETPKEEHGSSTTEETSRGGGGSTRYLKCPAAVTVRHLVRLLMLKRGWEEANATVNGVNNRIEITYQQNDTQHPDEKSMHSLDPSWTLLDLACIFRWKKELPMKLFYRVLRKEEAVSISRVPSYKDDATKDGPPTIENMQRPPTPPPSPKPSAREPEAEARGVEPPRALETNTDKETRTKKPRCEVTPVMRTPDPPSAELPANNQSQESAKSKDLTRLEHRKRRKRRNKRVIAEITTTPREDLLKLKVRLTPRPPRITSGAGTVGGGGGSDSGNSGNGGGMNANNQAKEKLLQLRSVRREKIKAITQQQRWTAASSIAKEEITPKECATVDVEETIEDIIDSIPDEVVCIAQNINTQSEDAAAEKTTGNEKSEPIEISENNDEPERPKKDEEILRRLGLVAIKEISGDKTAKQRAHSSVDKASSLDREKLEKQLRESKANRVRSLLAEKQMRDALKSIMSKTKEERSASASDTSMSASTSVSVSAPVSAPKKKEPPPLAPLRVAKPSDFAATSGVLMSNAASKYETPLDLSSGGTVANDNALDLSATLPGGGRLVTFSSSSSPSSSSSSSSSSPSSCSISSLPSSKAARSMIGGAGGFLRKSKEFADQHRKGAAQQESNLRTLSDVAVSRLSGCLSTLIEKNPTAVEPFALASANIHAAASKVALRIPQPHQRISGFGMKIKPNLGVRHIPNPQAVVASQYRNQRANYFNTVSQQPP
ncbi:polycomb group protein Psc-like [Linepithema humile]|uniref:polycomb group protein Psc-like n=1 Tax=Linepithema humile TaxID=83485 RepID=UPI0006233552|nr:PREDICTED: polycomb group protein Psc-like [Linepithema humile]